MNIPTFGGGYQSPPPKIQAAMDYLRFVQSINQPNPMFGGESWKESGRDVTNKEQQVYDEALKTLLAYFKEPGFGGESTGKGPDDDNPKEPERQPV